MYHLLFSVSFKLCFVTCTTEEEKKALDLHPCLVFALYKCSYVLFSILSLVNYQFPPFAVVFYTYTESHIFKLCLKNKYSYKHVFWHRIWYLIIGQ